ncbi:RNA polymerase sigma factor [Gracilibacillus thailandensis]|uniref:RNA polymerase sigma factor n=1 Tax=Gracilibacillus thailandensis TaxID=563735 RepID=A0A6N7R651_9BACI|nr:RNA polymerase sigma factor [Gracilibacillus thailandensis]MRI68717.1 sigma-70 family RNA polymerase sigma factor [Gracilibacillus thailandensis]
MDEELITDWFDAYSDDIYRFLVYYTSTSDVEDLVQEVFIKAIDRYDSFKGDSSPKTWLFSIARNLAIDEARKQTRQDWRKLIKTYEHKIDISPEDKHLLTEKKLELHKAITKLKQDYRDVVILRGIEELSVTETADILKWSDSKVRVTFHRALKALKLQVKEVYYES